MTTHIMLDLETWGTRPGCDLRSIGAVVFDPTRGEVALAFGDGSTPAANITNNSFYIATDNPGKPRDEVVDEINGTHDAEYPHYDSTDDMFRKYPLTRDPKTVQWWNDQSEEARAAFTDPVDLRDALVSLTYWLDEICTPVSARPHNGHTNLALWSHGPSFDVSILSAAYEAVGLPIPWHYRAPRDTRTCFDMAGIDDHSAWLDQHATGTAHNALDDAICQARAVCAAYERAGLVTSDDGETLRQRAITATQAYDDWTNRNETDWTGWGDMIVPDGATKWRQDSGKALSLLKGSDPE